MTLPAPRLLLAVALGGALGAVLRAALGFWVPDSTGFPWTTFAINVVGAFALAAIPAIGAVRRSPTLTAGSGAGLLGGFTTLSTTSEQARSLVERGDATTAALYLAGTLAAAVVAVSLGSRLGGRLGAGDQARVGTGR